MISAALRDNERPAGRIHSNKAAANWTVIVPKKFSETARGRAVGSSCLPMPDGGPLASIRCRGGCPMSARDPRVDQYIERTADFAKPVLNHIRELVHSACPDVEETMKWRFPHFTLKGILCSMAAFKHHCAFGFWKGALVLDSIPEIKNRKDTAMGQFGRITNISDLPDRKLLTRCIVEAIRLNETGTKVAKPKTITKALVPPEDLMASLKKNKKAMAVFQDFSYSHRNEYVEWITAAKTEATRAKRLKTAVAWMTDGKSRNWKYVK